MLNLIFKLVLLATSKERKESLIIDSLFSLLFGRSKRRLIDLHLPTMPKLVHEKNSSIECLSSVVPVEHGDRLRKSSFLISFLIQLDCLAEMFILIVDI